jgi:hypothetical protein
LIVSDKDISFFKPLIYLVMKRILKTTTLIFFAVSAVATMHSCEEKQSAPDQPMPALGTRSNRAPDIRMTALSLETIKVTDCNLGGWIYQKQSGATGTIEFVNGPAETLSGNGSLRFNCPDQKFLRLNNNQYIGTLLSDISSFSYSTFVQQSGSLSDDIFLVIQVDINSDGNVDFPIVFNPVFQTGNYVNGIAPDQGITQTDIWQTWDLLNGVWWRGDGPDPWNQGALFTIASLIGQYPAAVITNQGGGPGAVRISGGAPYFTGTFIGYADNFTIGLNGQVKVYDFENTANAGADQTVVYGYGSGCTILTGEASGGAAPYSYSWSPGGSAPDEAVTSVCPVTTTKFTLTVTDANGCISTDDVTVYVNDVRCGNKMDKVRLCHNGKEICVSASAVQAHLDHGDALGSCPVQAGSSKSIRQ